jgi:hypothetical protein
MSKKKLRIIDISLIPKELSLNDVCALVSIYDESIDFKDTDVDYDKLEDKKYIKIIKDERQSHFILRQKATELLELFVGEEVELRKRKKKKKSINVDVLTRIPEFRAKWKGLKRGSMGSLQSCKDKLARWMNDNPDYTFDEILAAADAYIESLGGDYRFLQRADYFIYKQENNREESSRLSAFIDELSLEDPEAQGDWTTQMI